MELEGRGGGQDECDGEVEEGCDESGGVEKDLIKGLGQGTKRLNQQKTSLKGQC